MRKFNENENIMTGRILAKIGVSFFISKEKKVGLFLKERTYMINMTKIIGKKVTFSYSLAHTYSNLCLSLTQHIFS